MSREKEFLLCSRSLKGTIKEKSPFRSYYDLLLQKDKQKRLTPLEAHPNLYFAPELFELIRNRLYLMPLWSSVMIGDWCSMTGRIPPRLRGTNNPVENYFNHLKVRK